MSVMHILLGRIKSLLPYMYAVTTTAEIRTSSASPILTEDLTKVQWTDFFGTPYQVTVATGGETLTPSGWVDTLGKQKIHVQSTIQGAGGATGNVVIKFMVGGSPRFESLCYVDTALNITIASNGANLVTSNNILDVSNHRYIRVYSVTHSVGTNVDVTVKLVGGGSPVIL